MTTRNPTLLKALSVAALAAAMLGALPAVAETVLKVVPQADLKNLDPNLNTATITQQHGYMVYDVLVGADKALNWKPQMLEGWTVSADGLTYAFKLRPGQKWHDGTPVTAKDAVASLERWAARSGDGKTLMKYVGSIAPKGDAGFDIVLKEKVGIVLSAIGNPFLPAFMMREKDARLPVDEPVKEAIGSGPFTFVQSEWQPGHQVVYKRNAAYVPRAEASDGYAGGKAAKVDRVEWLYIPDANTAVQSLMKGEIDVVEQPATDLIPILAKDKGVTLKILDPFGTIGMLRFNHLHPPFNDARIRRAALHAIDQKALLDAMVGQPDLQKECLAVFMCGGPFESAVGTEPFLKPDIAAAKRLLAEAGYKGEPIVLMDPTDQNLVHNISIVAAAQLRGAGFNVDLQSMDWSTMTSRRGNKARPGPGSAGWNIFPTFWTGFIIGNPGTNIPLAGDAVWPGWYTDVETERLRGEFLTTADRDAQKRIADALQRRYYEQVPYLSTGQFRRPVAWRSNVTGVPETLSLMLWNIEKK
jgi:peptide/nickel transport system substrate-binding protein